MHLHVARLLSIYYTTSFITSQGLKASPEGITPAKIALTEKTWSQHKLATALGITRQPVSKFFAGESVSRSCFVQICQQLGLSWQKVAGLSQDVAFEAILKKEKILQVIADYLDSNSEVTQLQLDQEAVLKVIEIQDGLLVERAQEIYSFSHLTLQKYFTARKIVGISQAPTWNNLVSHITELRYQ
ncbi:MAG: hypothetical protein V7K97_16235 [Nostoc sp.]|uniref:hypothetical protein n=1 Tax=Nostoc sp. TaxID=1180 RepID=UPI002FF49F18